MSCSSRCRAGGGGTVQCSGFYNIQYTVYMTKRSFSWPGFLFKRVEIIREGISQIETCFILKGPLSRYNYFHVKACMSGSRKRH